MPRVKSARPPGKRSGRKTGSAKSRMIKEQERLRQEEEEQRLRAEEEEKRKEAAAAKQQYEEEVNAKLANLRRKQELRTEREFEAIKSTLVSSKEKLYRDPDWERYTRCDGKPDPSSLPQINTFITITKESTNHDINVVLEESKTILGLIKELKRIIKDPYQNIRRSEEKIHLKTIDSLESLLLFRYDVATQKILKEAVKEADSDTGNLQKIIEGENEVILLWGNLVKNPRFKSFRFDFEQVFFEIPKPLAMTDFTFRLLKTKFDPYSHQCKSYQPRWKQNVESEAFLPDVSKLSVLEEKSIIIGELEEPNLVDNFSTASLHSTASAAQQSKISLHSSKRSLVEGVESRKLSQVSNSNFQPPPSIPDCEIEEEKSDDIEEPEATIASFDLRLFTRLGDVYHIQIIELPPQQMILNGWTWQQIIDKPLTELSLPNPIFALRSNTKLSASNLSNSEEKPVGSLENTALNLLGVSFRLPENVKFFEKPELGIWNKTHMCWTFDGIINMAYEEETRVLSFDMIEPGIVGLFQKIYLNMPFKGWELRPIAVDSCYLSVTGKLTKVEFEFKGTQCRLITSDQRPCPELTSIYNIWKSVNELITLMEKSGVAFFPREDAADILEISSKKANMQRFYQQMAILSTSVAFTWSKWNSSAPVHQLVFKAAPFCVTGSDHDLDSVPEDDWAHFVAADDRAYKLKLPYYSDEYEDLIADDCEHQCDLLHALRETKIPLDEGDATLDTIRDRSQSIDAHFVEALYTMLIAVNPISFSE